jgi:hypothetical protein
MRTRTTFERAAAVSIAVLVIVVLASGCVMNGAWAPLTITPVPGVDVDDFTGASCVTATSCVAVGHRIVLSEVDPIFNVVKATFATWEGGTWTEVALPGSRTTYRGVACSSASQCVAPWIEYDLNTMSTKIGVDLWRDGHLSALPLSVPTYTEDAIVVGCVPGGTCTLANAASTWTVDGASVVEQPHHLLVRPRAIDCATSSFCLVVGQGGGAWTLGPTGFSPVPDPAAPGSSSTWSDVACRSASWCEVVGRSTTLGVDTPAAAHWDGTALAAEVLPAGTGSALVLSCASTIACVATPTFGTAGAVAYNGATWYTAPTPPGPSPTTLHDISCAPGTTQCLAVGGSVVRSAATYAWTN